MKNKLIRIALLVFSGIVLLSSCKKSEEEDKTETSTTREASFKIGAASFSVTKPYLGIFNDNGTIKNTMKLTATDGSKVEFYFIGSSPNTYPLMSYSNGYYVNAAGKQFNSTSGQLIVSSYTIDGTTYKASGTFQFKAKAISAPIDSLEITSGVFTNASNEN
jgi:hypothetical protein